MKKRYKINFRTGLILVLLTVLALVLCPFQVNAQDTDGDGLLDTEEISGLDLPGWLELVDPDGNTISTLVTYDGYLDRNLCVDPLTKDLFIILEPADPGVSNITQIDNLFEYVEGLGITVHVLTVDLSTAPTDLSALRDLGTTLGQKAITAQESVRASPMLGKCDEEWCTPNSGYDNIWVWTQAIIDHIDETCGSKECFDSATGFGENDRLDLYNLYIKHTFAHEVGHDIKLRKDNVIKTGGWHYLPREKKVLSQGVYFREGKTSITWYIGTEHARDDPQDVRLYELQ